MARVAMRNACGHNVNGALLVTLGRDGQQDARTGANPDKILTAKQRGNAQTGGLVLADDLIAVGEHLVYGGGEIDFGNQLVAIKKVG